MRIIILTITCILINLACLAQNSNSVLRINDSGYFETRGLNVFVFNNIYDGNFSDAKISSIELIHHGIRTATNGDVRLSPTPGQWDPIPTFIDKKVDKNENIISANLSYPDHHFEYTIKTEAKDNGIIISVILKNPLPKELEGKAGFNLEFLPSAYFEKAYLMDNKAGIFPLYPGEEMGSSATGTNEPEPIATGKSFVLAPEDPFNMVSIKSDINQIMLFDGRNQAQNGWYVVRSLIPSGKTGTVVEWFLTANSVPNWIRKPVIEYSQLGYHPNQKKVAVVEFDKNDHPLSTAVLLKLGTDGKTTEKYKGELKHWGNYLRYNYGTFDFSQVTESGLYEIKYDTIITKPFRIDSDIYTNAWQPTLDIYFPVQMDHMLVNEAYKVWHGAAHLDDALQAPVNHEHFDLYAQGPNTDSPYKPGEHIPGLNIGGWFDAGDFDIRTESQYAVVLTLAHAWEDFGLNRDETTINEKTRYVDLHHPDGKPDMLQQIEHGTLGLIAQYRAVGHAINGIIEAHIKQYRHLGDASSITDNLIYNPKLDSLQSDGFTSGTFDDRWAFTTKSTALDYGSIAALTAAGRVLRGFDDTLAEECTSTAKKIWDEEHSHKPDIYVHGNTTGGPLEAEELKAAVELLISTKNSKYASRITELLPYIEKSFIFVAVEAIRAIPYMDESYSSKIEALVKNYSSILEMFKKHNPFGVLITAGGWAGDGVVIDIALTNYIMHKAFPKIIDKEFVYSGLNYIYGCHPGSNVSFVSGIGTHSKRIAYGNNRADFTFIAGGIVPGDLILKPDFPENKEDWPFFWGENEYVIPVGSSYIYLVNAVNDLLNEK
jgi:hypothetical protein